MGSGESWRGSVRYEALGDMKVDQERESRMRRVGKVRWEDWESGESGGRCFVEGLKINGFVENILG